MCAVSLDARLPLSTRGICKEEGHHHHQTITNVNVICSCFTCGKEWYEFLPEHKEKGGK